MSQKTIRKQLLYKSSLSHPDNNIERDRSSKKQINKSVHYSTSGLKKEPNDCIELSTKEHKKIMSATISPQTHNDITKKKGYRKIKNNGNRAQQDLEIMKIFTSPEWSEKTFHKSTNPIVNSIMVNDDKIPLIHTQLENVLSRTYNEAESMEYLDTIQEITDQETEETDYVEEKQTVQYVPNESFNSVQQLAETEEKELENNLQESITESIVENRNSMKSFELSSYNSKTEHEYDMSFETPEDNIIANDFESRPSYITPNVEASDKSLREVVDKSYYVSNEDDVYENQICAEHECYSYRECCEEEETSPKHNSVVSTPNLSSEETLDEDALMRYFNFDDFSNSFGSEIVDPSPTGSLNTDVMTRIIRQNISRNYMTEKQMSNESAFTETMDLIFDETKVSLGTLLVEGLYIVSKRRRQNSFKYLGEWLLIQADIRDENQAKEESMSSF